MRRVCLTLFLLFFCGICSQSHADLIVRMFDTGGNVRIEYSGTLNMSGVAFTEFSVPVEEHALRYSTPVNVQPFNSIINLYNPPASPLRTYTNAFSSAPGVYYIGNRVDASSFGGNALFLPTGSNALNATLRLAPADFVGDVWSGSGFLHFNGRTIASLGIDTATKTWTINNAAANTITMTIQAVPEPGSAFLLMSSLGLLAFQRHRRPRALVSNA